MKHSRERIKKQNRPSLLLLALASLLVIIWPANTFAATTNITGGTNGPLCNSGGYFTPASVTVTSGDTITFSVPSNDPYAGGVQVNGFPQGSFVVPRGGSVTTQTLTANVSYQGTWPGDPSCIKGSGAVTVQAASSPPSTSGSGSTSSGASPPPASSNTSSTSPPSRTPSTASSSTVKSVTSPTTQPTTVPETVVADTITVAGKKVSPPEGQGLTIDQSQPLVLAGTTVPNGKITLTIHSNPTTAIVQADSSGKWSYTVTGLAPGGHTIYAAVTDPANNQTSAQSRLLAFTIAAAPVASVTYTHVGEKKSSSSLVPVIIGVFAVLAFATGAVFVLKRRSDKMPAPEMSLNMVVRPESPTATATPQGDIQSPTTPNRGPAEEHKG